MNAWSELHNFGSFVYTVGDGVKRETIADLNTMSTANAEMAVEAAEKQNENDPVIFIAGGNSGVDSPRPTNITGALTEAERMRLHIQKTLGSNIPVLTDCDGEFYEQTLQSPSGNTPANSRNAAAAIGLEPQLCSNISVIAEQLHWPRVVGTLRKQLHDRYLLCHSRITGDPVDVAFDPESDQEHICSEAAFRKWDSKARFHHVLLGHVLRGEFAYEWLTGRNYKHLHERK